MFQVNDYVFYGSGGICRIDSICAEPFEGAPEGVLYYVLHTLSEPKQTIWNPVENKQVLMRHVMKEEEIFDLFRVLPTLSPLEAPNAKLLREQYIQAIKSAEPTEWGRVLVTVKKRLQLAEAKLLKVTDAEKNFFDTAKRSLAAEIALVLSISQADAMTKITEILDVAFSL